MRTHVFVVWSILFFILARWGLVNAASNFSIRGVIVYNFPGVAVRQGRLKQRKFLAQLLALKGLFYGMGYFLATNA